MKKTKKQIKIEAQEEKEKIQLLNIVKNKGACKLKTESCNKCIFYIPTPTGCRLPEIINLNFRDMPITLHNSNKFDSIVMDKTIEYYEKKWGSADLVEELL